MLNLLRASNQHFSFEPLLDLGRTVARTGRPPLRARAVRSWDLAPGHVMRSPRAWFLPDQLDRVNRWVFSSEHPRRCMIGGEEIQHAPARAFLFRDACLLDGVLYAAGTSEHLRPRTHRVPRLRLHEAIERGAIYCTHPGNTWFGQWLLDDCATYRLAENEGTPVTTGQSISRHAQDYEAWLGMQPHRTESAFFKEVILFHDTGHNRDKHRRFAAMRESLRTRVDARPHPGVFLLRGTAGERRVLTGELALAEHLQRTRGFRILDPMRTDVATIVRTCAGARVVMGIEGSQLIHGLLTMDPDGTLFVLQPQDRFCPNYKHICDRDGLGFAFVVLQRSGEDYDVSLDEVDRTLDLLPPTSLTTN